MVEMLAASRNKYKSQSIKESVDQIMLSHMLRRMCSVYQIEEQHLNI